MKKKISQLQSLYAEYFKEREDEINGALLAVLSGENVIYLGPPGTAKTYLANKICQSIEGTNFFYYLLTRFTTPDEVFGPLSLKALEKDEFRRNIDGCLPTAHIALLDEIFKANSSILNSLLTILNERKFHNGKSLIDVPLLSVFGASNELPEENENLEALYDRFLFRYAVDYIQNDENFSHLITSTDDFVSPVRLTLNEIQNIRKQSLSIPLDDDVLPIILSLRKELNSHSIPVSDRRWKKIIQCLKVAAAANGDSSVNKSMVLLLQHILWEKPEQKESIRRLLTEAIVSNGINLTKLQDELTDLNKVVDKESVQGKNLAINTTTCISCNRDFVNSRSLIMHHNEKPDHVYSLRKGGLARDDTEYSFDTIMKALGLVITKEKTASMSPNEKLIRREMEEIKTKYQRIGRTLEAESKQLKNSLNNNIWLSRRDRDEVFGLHQKKKKDRITLDNQIAETDTKINHMNVSCNVEEKRNRSAW
jgi:MoxR-like ATPase